jgi:hypothetical protein
MNIASTVDLADYGCHGGILLFVDGLGLKESLKKRLRYVKI